MAPQHLRRFRRGRFIVPLAALLVAGLLVVVLNPASSGPMPLPGAQLTSATNFTLQGSVANLTPGVSTSTLTVTVTNPYSVGINLNSLTVASVSSSCLSYLTLNGSGFTGATPSVTITAPTAPLPVTIPTGPPTPVSLPITLSRTAPNSCQNVTFPFTYSGTALYTATTSTTLSAVPTSSNFGQSVALTANVAPTVTPDPGAGNAVGTVVFYDCGTDSTCASRVALSTPKTLVSGQVSFSTSSLTIGTHYLDVTFTPTDSQSYAASTSSPLLFVVGSSVACSKSTISGGLTVNSGQSVCLTSGSKVNGGLTVKSGGAVQVTGATINGGISATGATAIRLCGSTINGNATITGSTGFVEIGDGSDAGDLPPPCAGNTFTATSTITISSNTAGFEFAGNVVTGTVSISGNTATGPTPEDAAPEVEGNHITGSLSCANPGLTNGGQTNTVSGTRSGQCVGSGF